MKYDVAGTYEFIYKATDECGNETVQLRNIIVEDDEYPYTMFEIGSYSGTIYGVSGTESYAVPSDVEASIVHEAPTAEYVEVVVKVKGLTYNGESLGDSEIPLLSTQFEYPEMWIPLTDESGTWIDSYVVRIETTDNWQSIDNAAMYSEVAPLEGYEATVSWESITVDVIGESGQ